MSEAICEEWSKKPLYWATIEYHRFWLSVDQPRLEILRQKGEMTPVLLRDIAREYRVSRSLKKADKNSLSDGPAEAVCRILKKESVSWNDDLSCRKKSCLEIIEKMRPFASKAANSDDGADERNPVSAATKFIWFMKPVGWTIFDKYAATGIGIPETGRTALERMDEFYTALEYEGFPDLVGEIQSFISQEARSLRGLPAERILDTLFMARGKRGAAREHGVALTKAYLNGLGGPLREQLTALAKGLQKQFGNRPLVNKCEPIKRNKAWAKKHLTQKNVEYR
jgi:hypothetical protein